MPDRTARLMAVIDLLQAHGTLTTGSIAERLGVSERTVRRDLVSLQDLDLPVHVRPGRHGGVTIEPGALLAPLRFTDGELVALQLGARWVATGQDPGLARAARGALQRLASVMTPRARARARALEATLAEAPAGTPASSAPASGDGGLVDADVVLQLAEAIRMRERVKLHYTSPTSGHTVRQVDPYGLVRIRHWYVSAHCHLRNGLRTFRLDRIRRLERTTERFTWPTGFDTFASVAASIALAPWPDTVLCRVWIAADLERARAAVPPHAVVLEPDGGGVLLSTRYPVDDLEHFALHLLWLPWALAVREPAALRRALRAVSTRALRLADA